MIDIKRGFSVMIGGMETGMKKSNLLPKIDLHGNRSEIGKRMIECAE